MSGDKTTKTVFRMLMFWNDEKEGRWLAQEERSGWHLKAVRCFGYTFERSTPGDVAYRLDYFPARLRDRSEYLGLFHDAGWEHVGTRGHWQYFRKAVVDGHVPEIYTDPQSRIVMYRRLLGLSVAMLAVIASQMLLRLDNLGLRLALAHHPFILLFQVLVTALFAYGTVRLLLVISRLKRSHGKQA